MTSKWRDGLKEVKNWFHKTVQVEIPVVRVQIIIRKIKWKKKEKKITTPSSIISLLLLGVKIQAIHFPMKSHQHQQRYLVRFYNREITWSL